MTVSVHPCATAGVRPVPRGAQVDRRVVQVLQASFDRVMKTGTTAAERVLRRRAALTGHVNGTRPEGQYARELTDAAVRVMGTLDDPAGLRREALAMSSLLSRFGYEARHGASMREMFVEAMRVCDPQWTRELEQEWRLAVDLLRAALSPTALTDSHPTDF